MTTPKPRYTVFCDTCYSFHREHTSKKAANVDATSHLNAYGHPVHILTTPNGA